MSKRDWSSLPAEHRSIDSPLHRLPAGVKIIAVLAGSALAIALDSLAALAALAIAEAAGYALARLRVSDLWRDLRWILLQGALLVALYVLRDGLAEGLAAGGRTSLQLALFFLPGALLLRTTDLSGMIGALRRVLPGEWAFVAGSSLRFVPFFARELGEIVSAQRLRGVPLRGRALLHPRSWALAARSVLIPLLVRAVRVANEAGLAAEGRGIRVGGEHGRCGIEIVRPERAPLRGELEERVCES